MCCSPMIGYKLFRVRRDGSLGPLFINRKQVIEVGKWMAAESHPTKGFALRPGWHACLRPVAPHLKRELKSGERRVWCKVKMVGCRIEERPESQGGSWVLAEMLQVVEILED